MRCLIVMSPLLKLGSVNITFDAKGIYTREEGWMNESGAIYSDSFTSLQQNNTMCLLNDVSLWHVHIHTHTCRLQLTV